MGRTIGTIAVVVALGLLGASPSSADVSKPKPGKWEGKLTQLFAPPGGGDPFDFGQELTFRVKRVSRAGAAEPKFKIVKFDTEVIFKSPFAPCGRGGWGLIFSESIELAGSRYRFAYSDSGTTVYPEGRVEYFESITGKFTGKSKAKGGIRVDFFDSASADPPTDCESGRVRWTAHRVR